MKIYRKTSIEGLRAIGMILVIVSHFAVMFYPASYWENATEHINNGIEVLIGSTPLGFFMNGNTGVMLFMTISGGGYILVDKN